MIYVEVEFDYLHDIINTCSTQVASFLQLSSSLHSFKFCIYPIQNMEPILMRMFSPGCMIIPLQCNSLQVQCNENFCFSFLAPRTTNSQYSAECPGRWMSWMTMILLTTMTMVRATTLWTPRTVRSSA